MVKGKKFFLITVDDLRRDRTSLEFDRDTTPFLKRFADENSYQRHHFSVAPASPGSFRSIFSSTYPKEYRDDDYLSEDRPYLPDILSEAGVRTVGLTTNPYLSSSYGFQRGYDSFKDTVLEENGDKSLKGYFKALKSLARRLPFRQHLRAFRDKLRGKNTPYMEADEVAARAKEIIESEESESATFFWFHFMDPHYPFIPPEETFGTWSSFDSKKEAWKALEAGSSEEVLDLYDECILFLDRNLQELVEFIEERNAGQDYEILITSDHGELFLEDSVETFGHPSILDEKLYEVPLFTKGDLDREFSTHIDLAPTVLNFFDVDIPREMKGVDLFSGREKKHDFVHTHEFSREDIEDNRREPKVGKITSEGIVDSISMRNPEPEKIGGLLENAENTYYFEEADVKGPGRGSELTEEQEEKVRENLRQLGYDE